MDEKKNTIGLAELFQDITVRINMLRDMKHPKAHDIALWWELEKQVLSSKYSVVDCKVALTPPRRRWRKRIAVPGRWLDILVVGLCLGLIVISLLR